MTDFLDQAGRALLFTIAPGLPFILTSAGTILVLAVLRVSTSGSRWMQATLRVTRTAEHLTITLLLVSMIVLSLIQIALRNFFETGLVWVDPFLRHAVLWLGFMGAALATAHDRHIAIDALSRLLGGVSERVVHAALRLLASAVCLALANAAYGLLRDDFEFESTSFLAIPTWVLMLVMPVGLLVMSYRFVISAWRGRPDETIEPLTGPAGETPP